MTALPLFPVTTVGSLPRPTSLLRALKAKRRGDLSEAEFDRIADDAVLDALRLQEAAGVDIVTDGEQRRDNFYSFVSDKLDGVRLMSLAEMLDYVEDKAGFREAASDAGCARLLHQQPDLRGQTRAGGNRWRWRR